MKVLLINPPFRSLSSSSTPEPPMGLVYLGTVLAEHGFDVKILDASNRSPQKTPDGDYFYGMDNVEIARFVENFQPDVVGLGCLYASKWHYLLEISRMVKEISTSCRTVAGGIYPSMCPEEAIQSDASIDFCIIGEAEYSFLELCRILESVGRGPADPAARDAIRQVDGIVLRENGGVVINRKKSYIQNLDELPFPDYDLIEGGAAQYFENDLFGLGKHYLPLLSSRSCPNRCSFCNMRFTHGEKFRYRSAENVLLEIKRNYDKYGIKKFHFLDDNVSLIKSRFMTICKGIRDLGLGMKWASINGIMINTLDREVISLMGQSGCKFVALAIESADPEIRKNVIGKPIREEKIIEVVSELKRENIFISGYFVIGFLEDNDESMRKNADLISHLRLNMICVSPLQVYPGTDLFKSYMAKGLIRENYDITKSSSELILPNIELYEGYSLKILQWKKKLNTVFLFSLLKHPFDLLKFFDIYFNPNRIRTFIRSFTMRFT